MPESVFKVGKSKQLKDEITAYNTKSRMLLDFRRGAQRVSPVCCGVLLWFRWAGCGQVDQCPHGRDGHAPFFCAAKSNFKEAMVLA